MGSREAIMPNLKKAFTPVMKRAKKVMFAGKHCRFRNKVSFSESKTRIKVLPNIQNKTFYSAILDKRIKLKVTTTALRWIDKYGGFENYILKTNPAKLGRKHLFLLFTNP